jgi:hypothetical protein
VLPGWIVVAMAVVSLGVIVFTNRKNLDHSLAASPTQGGEMAQV